MDLLTMKRYEEWLNNSFFDEETRRELSQITDNEKEIEDRFYKDLEFGTGGLRGIIGAGTNRMNIYTVRKATQGLADYIKCSNKTRAAKSAVIAYDSRHMSREFSEEAALVLAANGIKVYLFENLAPTPELSFAVRHFKAITGIMITASHNPPEYNGYKVYGEDGSQITTATAEEITKKINEVADYCKINILQKEEAEALGLLEFVGAELEHYFIEEVKKQSLRRDIIKSVGKDFKIIFTPLHGTGNIPVRRVLKEIGLEQVIVVPEQELPDPNFSTVKSPNPEERSAFDLAINLARSVGADLILGTDPDCDRVGAVVRNQDGEFVVLTGNQTGALLTHYILDSLKEKNHLPKNGVIVKTIVTSEMGAVIAADYGIETINTLTGFKYIGEKIKEFEEKGNKTYLFGYEESYGYLAGTHARDKDAVVASMLIAEMTAYYYSKGMTLYEVLLALYKKYGYFLEDLKSITLKGRAGLEKIQSTLEAYRNNPPSNIAGYKVIKIEDYLNQSVFLLPKANVLKFIIEGGRWLTLRPSGTEPKLKIYGGVNESSMEESKAVLSNIIDYVSKQI